MLNAWSRKRELKGYRYFYGWRAYTVLLLISQERIERVGRFPGILAFHGLTDLARENWKTLSVYGLWHLFGLSDLARENWKAVPSFFISSPTTSNWSRKRELKERSQADRGWENATLISQERIERYTYAYCRNIKERPQRLISQERIERNPMLCCFLLLIIWSRKRELKAWNFARPPASPPNFWSRKRELKDLYTANRYLAPQRCQLISQERIESEMAAHAIWAGLFLISQERIERAGLEWLGARLSEADLARENWKNIIP